MPAVRKWCFHQLHVGRGSSYCSLSWLSGNASSMFVPQHKATSRQAIWWCASWRWPDPRRSPISQCCGLAGQVLVMMRFFLSMFGGGHSIKSLYIYIYILYINILLEVFNFHYKMRHPSLLPNSQGDASMLHPGRLTWLWQTIFLYNPTRFSGSTWITSRA